MLEEVLLPNVEWGLLQEILKRNFKLNTLVIIGNCEVVYEGRASSKASEARRLIIIKEDGSLLIHEGVGIEPINWQPNASLTSNISDEYFELTAIRSRPREVVKVFIKDRPHVMVLRLRKGAFTIKGTEDDLINYVASNPSIIEENAKLVAREFITPHGRVDVILRSANDELILVECKRGMADLDAVHQLLRYVDYYRSLGLKVKGVIASPSISPQALKLLLKNNLSYVKVSMR
ncbi:MAG: endonuclease NucS [Sulfolobales archaeon]